MAEDDSSFGEVAITSRNIPVTAQADVVVIGGGPAGFGAATRAAQKGADTILIERFGGLGGNMTNAFMCAIIVPKPGLNTEMLERLKSQGQVDVSERYPGLWETPVYTSGRQRSFYPDMAALVMQQILQENRVRLMVRTAFIDALVSKGGDTIEAVIVENASGVQAVKGKVFIDCTGRGNLVVRSGAPYMKTAEGLDRNLPIPSSLLWKLSNVNFESFIAYLKQDPALAKKIAEAKAAGDVSNELFRPRPVNTYGSRYKGHDTIDLCQLAAPGDALMECSIPYEWGLNCADNGADASRAEVEMRNFILAEWKFLRKYVPGFENAFITGIAPLMGQRDGNRPIGEYVLTYDDVINNRKFPDAVLKQGGTYPFDLDVPSSMRKGVRFDIPYRAFLPKKIDNLLVAGDCLAFEDNIRVNLLKSIPLSMITGEVAGISAAYAAKQGISVKEVKWTHYYVPDDHPVAFAWERGGVPRTLGSWERQLV
jgi:hypothetical protein